MHWIPELNSFFLNSEKTKKRLLFATLIKASEEDEEEIQEVIANPATAKETRMSAAVVTVLLEAGCILTLKGEQKTALKAFLCGQCHLA